MEKGQLNADLKFIYDKIYDEMNRLREWPVKLLGFSSGLYISTIAALKTVPSSDYDLPKCIIEFFICAIGAACIGVLISQHIKYLKYRNIQRLIQLKMGVNRWYHNGERIIPTDWDKKLKLRPWVNWMGWTFYAFVIGCLTALSCYLVSVL